MLLSYGDDDYDGGLLGACEGLISNVYQDDEQKLVHLFISLGASIRNVLRRSKTETHKIYFLLRPFIRKD